MAPQLIALLGCAPEEVEVIIGDDLNFCANFHEQDDEVLSPANAFPRNARVIVPKGTFSVPIEYETREPESAESRNVDIGTRIEFPNDEQSVALEVREFPMTALADTDVLYGEKDGALTVTTAELAPLYRGSNRDGWLRLRWQVPFADERVRLEPYEDETEADRVSVASNDTSFSQCNLSGFPRIRRTLTTERGDIELSWRYAEQSYARVDVLADHASIRLTSGELHEQEDWRSIVFEDSSLSGGFLLDAPQTNVCGYWFANMDNPLGRNPGPSAEGYEIECATMELINPFDILDYEEVIENDGP